MTNRFATIFLLLFSLMLFSCGNKKEQQKDPETAKPKATTGEEKPAEGTAEAHGHTPCGSCGSHKHSHPIEPGKQYPNVFKTLPEPGTKVSCPIKGETFEYAASRPHLEHNGKVYVFGCNGCKSLFEKDPEAALKNYTFVEAP